MSVKLAVSLLLLAALVSCSDAEAEKAPEVAQAKEFSLVGYWESSLYEIAGKQMYLQFNQDGTVGHNNSYITGKATWMLTDSKNMLVLTTSSNSRQYKCSVEVPDAATLIVDDAGCLPGYAMINGMKGTSIYYTRK